MTKQDVSYSTRMRTAAERRQVLRTSAIGFGAAVLFTGLGAHIGLPVLQTRIALSTWRGGADVAVPTSARAERHSRVGLKRVGEIISTVDRVDVP